MDLENSFVHNAIIGNVEDSFILISKVPTEEPQQVFVVAIFLSSQHRTTLLIKQPESLSGTIRQTLYDIIKPEQNNTTQDKIQNLLAEFNHLVDLINNL